MKLTWGILLMCGGLAVVTIGGYLAKDGWDGIKEKREAFRSKVNPSFLMVVNLFGSTTPIDQFFLDVSFFNNYSKPTTVKEIALLYCDSPSLKPDPVAHEGCGIIKWQPDRSITVDPGKVRNERIRFGSSRRELHAALGDSNSHYLGLEISYLGADAKSHRKVIPFGRLNIIGQLGGYTYSGKLPTSKNGPSFNIELL